MAEEKQKNNYWTTARIDAILKDADEKGIDFKDVDNPFHENDPELRMGKINFEYTPEEFIELKKCATDVIYFANTYCNAMTDDGIKKIKLRDYQEQILKQYRDHRFNIFLSPRQSGKCFLPNSTIQTSDNQSVMCLDVADKYKKNTRKNYIGFFKILLYKIYNLI